MITLYSFIPPKLKQKALFRGTLFACFGLLLLIAAAIYGTPLFLKRWGIWTFGLGMGLVAAGLIPYRRLCLLETNPHQIIIEPAMWTISAAQKTLRFSPKAIQSIHYVEKKGLHGIKIEFHSGISPLFLPFFSYKTYANHLKLYADLTLPNKCLHEQDHASELNRQHDPLLQQE